MEAFTSLFAAILSEKWILAAFTIVMWWVERKERMADKARFEQERKDIIASLDKLSDALVLVKERLRGRPGG